MRVFIWDPGVNNIYDVSYAFDYMVSGLLADISSALLPSQTFKTISLIGLEGILNFLLHKAAGLADFGEILILTVELSFLPW